MKASYLFLALAFLCPLAHLAQAPVIHWQQALGGSSNDYPSALELTPDGGCIAVGYSSSQDGDVMGTNGGSDVWVVKLSSAGALQWEKNFGGSDGDIGSDIKNTADGGFIICGFTYSNDGDVTQNQGQDDFWLIKLDAMGNMEWQKTYGGGWYDEARGVVQTSDGGYAVVGWTGSNDGDVTDLTGGTNFDVWVMKADAVGNLVWQSTYGGTSHDYGNDIIEDPDGDLTWVGRTTSDDVDVSSNNGLWDVWLVHTTDSGAIQWEHTYGGTIFEEGRALVKAPSGYNIGGYSGSSNGDVGGNYGSDDYWTLYVNNDGSNILWEQNNGGSNSEEAFGLARTPNNRIVTCGFTYSTDGDIGSTHGSAELWVAELSNPGNLEWEISLGGSSFDEGRDIAVAPDGTYWVLGRTKSSNGDVSGHHGEYDFWIVKLGPPLAQLGLNALLEGPYDNGSGLMHDSLRQQGLIPLIEPYTGLGYNHYGEGGGESIDASILNVTGNDAIVDWVVIEVRDASDSTIIVNTKSALIQRDGDIVDHDGNSAVSMDLDDGNYYVSIRHRNHLGVMTATPLALSGGVITNFDFPTGSNIYGTEAMKDINGSFVLWSGDTFAAGGELKYTGLNNDRDPILSAIGGVIPTATVDGYLQEDVNMDGTAKYAGLDNDRDPILVNIGGLVPTEIREEQLP